MSGPFTALIGRDLRLALRSGGGATLGVVFFLVLVTLIPFAVGPDLNLLARIAPAILWIGALLSTLIGLDRLFQADEEDGTLDLYRSLGTALELVVLARILAHWIATGLPLVLAPRCWGCCWRCRRSRWATSSRHCWSARRHWPSSARSVRRSPRR